MDKREEACQHHTCTYDGEHVNTIGHRGHTNVAKEDDGAVRMENFRTPKSSEVSFLARCK